MNCRFFISFIQAGISKVQAGIIRINSNLIVDKKFPGEFDGAITHLKNIGFIAEIRKKEIKYYITDLANCIKSLGVHGYNVTRGKTFKL